MIFQRRVGRRLSPAARRCAGAVFASGFFLFLPPSPVSAGGAAARERALLPLAGIQAEAGEQDPQPDESGPGEQADSPAAESRGETVLRALAKAYPDRTGEVAFLDGDWTIEVYNERFYFAGGRLLPESLRADAEQYVAQPFYNYPAELPAWVPPTEEESARMREQQKLRETRTTTQQRKRSTSFYDALWRAGNRDEAWEHVKQIRFLGYPILIHYSILEELSLVEQRILRLANDNTRVRQWINSLSTVESWNWRNIAASQNRSYHAYGAAIDLLPKSLSGLETYWLWTSQSGSEWWNIPYTRRFHPPEEVIKIFESFGFIWGGKWRYYDTMHFEYRPEILDLGGIEQTDLRDLR